MRPNIKVWNPENPAQWNKTLAWTTVWLSTFSLTLGFCAWFLVPSLAPRLNEIGFSLTHSQLYWLVAMVGLSAGTLRILWTFFTPDSRYQNSCHTLNGFAFNPALLLGICGPAS